MPRRPANKLGPRPETLGWTKLMAWLAVPGNTMTTLSRIARVSQPSVFKWRWRFSVPTDQALRDVCTATGATAEDWRIEVPKRSKRRAA